MLCIGHQAMIAKVIAEDFLTDSDTLLLAHLGKTEIVKGRLAAFNNEGRGVVVELISVRPDPSLFGFFEDESECVVKFLMCAQPDKLAFPQVDIGLESLRKLHPRFRIQTVTGNNDIKIVVVEIRGDKVRLGVEAPREVPVHRREVYEAIQKSLESGDQAVDD